MNKQFLPILAAGLILSGASQIQAMHNNNNNNYNNNNNNYNNNNNNYNANQADWQSFLEQNQAATTNDNKTDVLEETLQSNANDNNQSLMVQASGLLSTFANEVYARVFTDGWTKKQQQNIVSQTIQNIEFQNLEFEKTSLDCIDKSWIYVAPFTHEGKQRQGEFQVIWMPLENSYTGRKGPQIISVFIIPEPVVGQSQEEYQAIVIDACNKELRLCRPIVDRIIKGKSVVKPKSFLE